MCIDSFKVRNDMCRYRPGAFSVLFLEEGENMLSPSDVIGVVGLILMTIQIVIMWLERRDNRKKDSSDVDPNHTDEPDLHTGL